jgi:hypothetical protein
MRVLTIQLLNYIKFRINIKPIETILTSYILIRHNQQQYV